EIGNGDHLWLHLCIGKGWLKYGVNPDILKEKPIFATLTNFTGNSPLFDLKIPDYTRLSPICKWKDVFLRMCHLVKNWSKGRYTVAPILKGHTDKVTAFDCQNNCLVSVSNDKTVRVWDLTTCQCVRRIGGFSDSLTAVKISGTLAVTGCGDGSISVINIATGQNELSFHGHSDSVNHICLLGSLIVSAGSDSTVRVWSQFTQELVHTMRIHTDEIEVRYICISL
ncbi:unnamed protein product, partial [Lymnaea stagnalis]